MIKAHVRSCSRYRPDTLVFTSSGTEAGQREALAHTDISPTLGDNKEQLNTGIFTQSCILKLQNKLVVSYTRRSSLCIALSQRAGWIIASAELVRGAISAERKFHQKQTKLLFSGL